MAMTAPTCLAARRLAVAASLAALAACAPAAEETRFPPAPPPPVTGPVAPGNPLASIEALRRDIRRIRSADAAARAELEAELDRLEGRLDRLESGVSGAPASE
jgi:hypothetical protein